MIALLSKHKNIKNKKYQHEWKTSKYMYFTPQAVYSLYQRQNQTPLSTLLEPVLRLYKVRECDELSRSDLRY